MSPQARTHDAATRAAAKKKPMRFKLGMGLLILYPLMWLFAAVVPFLALEAGAKAAIVGVDLAAAEGVGLVGIACVGKETYQAIKSRFRRKERDGSAGDVRDQR